MSRTSRPPLRHPGRCRPRVERLESRLALSASVGTSVYDVAAVAGPISASDSTASNPTGPIATLTSPEADVSTPPSVVTVTFRASIDPFSLTELDAVIQKQQNGPWVSVFNFNDAPTESFDPSGTQLSLTLAQPLAAGVYRVVFPVSSTLRWTSGQSVVNFSQDQVIGEFTVAQPGVTLGNATALTSPASATVSVSGSLDLNTDPGAVALDSFTLPAGHHWLIGAQVLAQQIGSPLRADLTLFNAQGTPIATSNTGGLGDPDDPDLFAGLDPGTYYVGISAADNVPGTPGGYDPASGARAGNLGAATGGAYQLVLDAVPSDAPTRVLGVSLQYADPLDPHPTGFALAFSGAIDLQSLLGSPSPGIALVNQAGQRFAVTLVAEHATQAQYFFLADEDLPAGQYAVVASTGNGGLTDLDGMTPVAAGEPAGVLATFQVSGTTDPNPDDLGPLYDQVFTGVSRETTLAPGAGVTYRFVVTFEGRYSLQGVDSGGTIESQMLGPGGSVAADNAGQTGTVTEHFSDLKPGVYYLQFRNGGDSPARLSWTLNDLTSPGSFESLMSNGVGQGPALNALSITGTTAGLANLGATGPAWSGQPTAGATGGTATTAAAGPSGNTLAPAGFLVTLGNAPVGRPTIGSDHVAAVGPTAGSGSTALASSTAGIPQGIGVTKAVARYATGDGVASLAAPSGRPATDPEPVNGALVAEAAAAPETRTDEAVLAAADWLTNAGNLAARWMALAPHEVSGAGATVATPAVAISLARDDTPTESPAEGKVERAQIDAPLALGLATAISFRYNLPFRRWLKRSRSGSVPSGKSALRNALRGPHVRF